MRKAGFDGGECERYEDNPSAANFYDCRDGRRRFGADEDVWLDTVYEEDIYVGYRYFETFHRNGQVAWPFGYGLSYTDFRTEPEQCVYDRESGLGISFLVKNVGEIPGKEVVQVYLAKPEGTLEKPARELVEFGKTRLLKKGGEPEAYLSDSRGQAGGIQYGGGGMAAGSRDLSGVCR